MILLAAIGVIQAAALILVGVGGVLAKALAIVMTAAAGACRSVACRTGFTAEENRRHLSGMKPRQIDEHKKFTIIVSTLA